MSASYPGNPVLSTDVKQRVVATFRQAIDLYRQGRIDEVLVGCDFLLKLDPMFDPAKKLLEKARNPSAAVDIDMLARIGDDDGDPLANARAALDERDFQRALELSTAVLRADIQNIEAQTIAQEAQEKIEAAPFVAQFITKARGHLQSGNLSGARTELEKGKTLDSMHPDLLAIQSELDGASAPASFDFGGSSTPFVVDTGSSFGSPAAPASTPPPASDFGFTFEEEQKSPAGPGAGSDFSFDSGPAFGGFDSAAPADNPFGAPPVDGNSFDFTTASVDVSADDQTKINQYLNEGDSAYESGDLQGAIDIWSRIFLIDVTNDLASERIERARKERLEVDRRIEELLGAANTAKLRGERDTARQKLSEALRLDPHHREANDMLAEIDLDPAPEPSFEEPPAEAASRSQMIQPLDDDLYADDFSSTSAPPLVPPAPGTTSASAKDRETKPVSKPAKKRSMGAILAVVAVIALGAGGFFAYKTFVGGDSQSTTDSAATLAQAQTLAQRGDYDRAIAMLVTIPAGDPQYGRAIELIADFKSRKSASSLINGRPRQEVFAEYVANARTAYEARDFMRTSELLQQAAAIQPLQGDAKAMFDDAAARVAKLNAARTLIKEGNYAEALVNLDRLQQEDPQNRNIQQLISNARFNLGALALQSENTKSAIEEFDRVLAQNPDDEIAKRSRDLAARYDGEQKDLLYRIYARHLPLR